MGGRVCVHNIIWLKAYLEVIIYIYGLHMDNNFKEKGVGKNLFPCDKLFGGTIFIIQRRICAPFILFSPSRMVMVWQV